MTRTTSKPTRQIIAGILFADVKGYSNLSRFQMVAYTDNLLPSLVTTVLDKYKDDLLEINTWGDAFFVLSSNASQLAELALDLRDFFRDRDWDRFHLPPLQVRIGLHAGEVCSYPDSTRRSRGSRRPTLNGWVGSELNLGARLEPVTPPNHVWTTGSFRDMVCGSLPPSNIQFESVGQCQLPKDAGIVELWHLKRPDDQSCPRPIRPVVVIPLPLDKHDRRSIYEYERERLASCRAGETVRVIAVTGRTALVPDFGELKDMVPTLESWPLPSAIKRGVRVELIVLDPDSEQAIFRSQVESGQRIPPAKRMLQQDAMRVATELLPRYSLELGMSATEVKRSLKIRKTRVDIGFSLWLFNDVAVTDAIHLGKQKGRPHLCHFARLVIPRERPEYDLLEKHFDTVWNAQKTKRVL